MLTNDILFGMNILTPACFVVMVLSLSLNRTGQIGRAVVRRSYVRGAGFGVFGLYAGSESR
jgi:hypothetical protein